MPTRRTFAERKRLLAEKRALDRRDAAFLDSPAVAQRVAAMETAYANAEKAWTPLEIVNVVSTGGATLTRQTDGSWLASGTRPDRDTYIVTAPRRPGRLSAMRLQVLPDASLPQHGPGRWDNGNFHLSEFRAFAAIDGKSQGAKAIAFAQGKGRLRRRSQHYRRAERSTAATTRSGAYILAMAFRTKRSTRSRSRRSIPRARRSPSCWSFRRSQGARDRQIPAFGKR